VLWNCPTLSELEIQRFSLETYSAKSIFLRPSDTILLTRRDK